MAFFFRHPMYSEDGHITYLDGDKTAVLMPDIPYDDESIELFKGSYEKKNFSFYIPEKFVKNIESSAKSEAEKNLLMQAYKVGFLRTFLEQVYPEKKPDDIYGIIKKEFQVYFSFRKLQHAYTIYKKNIKILTGVPY